MYSLGCVALNSTLQTGKNKGKLRQPADIGGLIYPVLQYTLNGLSLAGTTRFFAGG
jgi:hypothetical protein